MTALQLAAFAWSVLPVLLIALHVHRSFIREHDAIMRQILRTP